MKIKAEAIAVIGAGVMGCDLAIDLAIHDYHVYLKDITEEILQEARKRIEKNFKLYKLLKKEFPRLSTNELLSKISFVSRYTHFEQVDIVIENITESFKEKEKVYRELREICREDILYGVNTSCIPITGISELLPRPENVIGMHFLNPVPLKSLVEVVRGRHTSDETFDRTAAFLKSIGKTWIVVKDAPGFVANRVLMLTINECISVVRENIADPAVVDKIFTEGFSHKMGPLATADLIGLDTVLDSLSVLYECYKDSKFKPCPLLKDMVNEGRLGKKTGKGFFEYNL